MMKVDLPTLSEKLDLELFSDWVKDVKNFCVYVNTQEDKKVKLITFKLNERGVVAWWDLLKTNH